MLAARCDQCLWTFMEVHDVHVSCLLIAPPGFKCERPLWCWPRAVERLAAFSIVLAFIMEVQYVCVIVCACVRVCWEVTNAVQFLFYGGCCWVTWESLRRSVSDFSHLMPQLLRSVISCADETTRLATSCQTAWIRCLRSVRVWRVSWWISARKSHKCWENQMKKMRFQWARNLRFFSGFFYSSISVLPY